jgi:hypothetical protein
VGDSVNDVRDRMKHGAMCGCGSCEAPWNREEVAMGCKRRGVDDQLDELFASLGCEVTCGCKMSVGATGHVTCSVGTVMAKDGREKW